MSHEDPDSPAESSNEGDGKMAEQNGDGAKLNLSEPGDTGDLLSSDVEFAFEAAYTDGFPVIVFVTKKGLRHAPANEQSRARFALVAVSAKITESRVENVADFLSKWTPTAANQIDGIDSVASVDEGGLSLSLLREGEDGPAWIFGAEGGRLFAFEGTDENLALFENANLAVEVKSKPSTGRKINFN